MPAPTTHGVRRYLTSGKLPAECDHIRRDVTRLERRLEEAVIASRKSLTPLEASLIRSARLHETTLRLYERFLFHDESLKLTVDQKLAILRDMRAATSARDKAIAGLKLAEAGDVLNAWLSEEVEVETAAE